MKKIAVFVLLLSGIFLSANNLLKNPDFNMQNNQIKGWEIYREFCSVSEKILKITLPEGKSARILSDIVFLNQQTPSPITFSFEYKGSCKTKSWEHYAVLADLTYQDGTKAAWPEVLISIPKQADDWKKLTKTVKLPKPVKSFRLRIFFKDETNIEIRNPYIKASGQKNSAVPAIENSSSRNMLLNPVFAINSKTNLITGWGINKQYGTVSDNILKIVMKTGQSTQILSDIIVLNQKEAAPIHFGLEYKGYCNTPGWEHYAVLADLIYQDGTVEKWPKVLISIPKQASDWKKLTKTVKLPKPVKSFRLRIFFKDETNAEIRNPYVFVDDKKTFDQQTVIALPVNPLTDEAFAADELAVHIEKMTGKYPVIISEDKIPGKPETVFFIGRTQKAAENKIDFSDFKAEQWQIKSVDGGVLIGGGDAVGSLYGVYHYLEDVCGVRWFNVTENKIPQFAKLPDKNLNLSGEPAFRMRTIYTETLDFDSQFLSRNRMNGNFSNWKISIFNGIPFLAGPSCHTHCIWLNPAKYLKSNPEFYALQPNGKRNSHALCLTNPKCREAMISEIRTALRRRYAQASSNPLPYLKLVNVSHMDNQVRCHCADCKKLEAKYQAFSGCDIDFINAVATELKKEFPDVLFVTLAYTYTEKPPVGIKVADNVCVQMCDTTSNVRVPITHPDNSFFLQSLTGWTKLNKNVTIWDYWITFNFNDMVLANELPCATERNTAADLRTMNKLGVPFFFTEMEYYTASSDVNDYKLYIYLKLLENPSLDFDKLSAEFANEFYGPAGKLFLEYRKKLEEVQNKWKPHIDWNPHFGRYTYLNTEFLQEMHALFDRGEKLLVADPVRLTRWNRARISLDRAVCFRFSYLMEEFLRTGQPIEKFPFDLKKHAERSKKAVLEATSARYNINNIRLARPNAVKDAERMQKTAETTIDRNTKRFIMPKPAIPTDAQLPAELAKVSRDKLHIFPLASAFLFLEVYNNSFKLTPEKDSLFGCVAAYTFDPVKEPQVKKSLLTAAIYQQTSKNTFYEHTLPNDILNTPGWHWIKFKDITAAPNAYLALSGKWGCRFDISCLAGPEHKIRKCDLYLRARYTELEPSKAKIEFDTIIFK